VIPRPKMKTALLKALRTVEYKDSWSFRQAVFDDLTRRKPAIAAARAVYDALPRRASTLLVSGYALASFLGVRAPERAGPVLSAHAYRNEERQLEYLEGLLGEGVIARLSLDPLAALSGESLAALGAALTAPGDLHQALSVIHRFNAAGNFLVACRVASALGYYLRLRPLLARSEARATLVSSDTNPYAMGLSYAARSLGLPTVYITHGHIPDGPPPLDFDLSILDGPAVLRVYEEMGPTRGAVVYNGAEGTFRPMDTGGLRRAAAGRGAAGGRNLRVGLFLSLMLDWDTIGAQVQALRALSDAPVLVRLHPNRVVRPADFRERLGEGVELSLGERVLLEDAERCDVVFTGNSSCHLTLLKYGVPTVYTRGLDTVPHDFYRFLSERIVLEVDQPGGFDPGSTAAFYDDPEWAARFAFFDASYQRDQAALDRAVAEAIRGLLAPEGAAREAM
jgi:hypothetical protein